MVWTGGKCWMILTHHYREASVRSPAAMRIQEINPAKLTGLIRRQFAMSKVKSGETIVVLGVQRVRPGAEVVARPVGSGTPAAPVPAATREQPSRSSLNMPQAIGSAQAAERK